MSASIANGIRINDSVMELLIMISACKGGSAKSITGMDTVCFGSDHR
jgi:phosphoribosylpyrophosphate synthetase